MNAYAQLYARSSMAAKGITVLGRVIDPDYRGNIKVILQNNSKNDFTIHKYDRVAQIVFKSITCPAILPVTQLDTTEQGTKGFGSTEKR